MQDQKKRQLEKHQEEFSQEGHRRRHAEIRLTEVGEDGESQDGVGVELENADLVAGKDFLHEWRKWRDEPREEEMDEEGV